VHAHDGETLSAEKGYLRETGNLVFHVALIGVLVGVAWGHLLGWKGDVIVPVGQTFANTLSRHDTLSPGPWVHVNPPQPDPNRVAPAEPGSPGTRASGIWRCGPSGMKPAPAASTREAMCITCTCGTSL